MEVRPIDANALIDEYQRLRMIYAIDKFAMTESEVASLDAISQIYKAPTLDYAPVRHGEWGEYEAPYGFPSLSGFPCSVCGMHQTDIRGLYYCPNCGAKMDGEK